MSLFVYYTQLERWFQLWVQVESSEDYMAYWICVYVMSPFETELLFEVL